VKDLGELDVPACCRRRGKVKYHLRLHQFSVRRRRILSHHCFDSFCGVHLLFAYGCSTRVFGAIHKCFKHHCMRI